MFEIESAVSVAGMKRIARDWQILTIDFGVCRNLHLVLDIVCECQYFANFVTAGNSYMELFTKKHRNFWTFFIRSAVLYFLR